MPPTADIGSGATELHKHGAAVDDENLAGAVALPHQIDVRFGNLGILADVPDGQPVASLLEERFPGRLGHRCP